MHRGHRVFIQVGDILLYDCMPPKKTVPTHDINGRRIRKEYVAPFPDLQQMAHEQVRPPVETSFVSPSLPFVQSPVNRGAERAALKQHNEQRQALLKAAQGLVVMRRPWNPFSEPIQSEWRSTADVDEELRKGTRDYVADIYKRQFKPSGAVASWS